jgi:hypothetical protein
MRSAALAGFLPSTAGFRFVNRWPAGPAFELRAPYLRLGIGEVADGLCGGMCYAAADRFLAGAPVPPDVDAPPAGSALFEEIARRQLDSLHFLAVVPARFWATAARVASHAWSAADQVREWRALCADIDAGRPAMAGLVRSANVNPFALAHNHQVLGYAYEASAGEARLRIYDPNHPLDDEVALVIRRGATPDGKPAFSLEQTTGEPLLALLRLPYRPAQSGRGQPGAGTTPP